MTEEYTGEFALPGSEAATDDEPSFGLQDNRGVEGGGSVGGGQERERFDFAEWTVSRAGTYLNEKVYSEGREDLDDLREHVTSARGQGGSIELTQEEYDTFQNVVLDGADNELEALEGREANIFGDAQEQREIAREAKQDIENHRRGGGLESALDGDLFTDEEVEELVESYKESPQMQTMGVTPEQFATVAESNTDTVVRNDPRTSNDLFDPVGMAADTVNTFIDAARRNNGKNIDTLVSAGISREEAERLASRVEDPQDSMTQAEFEQIVEIEVKRARANGRFVKKEPQQTGLGTFRSPSNGRFVGDTFSDPEIGRNTETGRYVDLDGDA